jgi:hypothetical protein
MFHVEQMLHGQTKLFRLVHRSRAHDDSIGLHDLADIIGGVVVEVAVSDEK